MMDRGLMKWNGFFMPEQKELIRQIYKESLKTEKPILDEEQLHKMSDLLVRSMQDNKQMILTLWMDGYIRDVGPVSIHKIDQHQRNLYVFYKDVQQIFHFDSIIGVKNI
ncbi:YolD-like family protein [Niallia endozanthoxylica]|nr:YolD-like family protein [Niallia endozanthoxylica]